MTPSHKRSLILVIVFYVGACIETDLFLPALPEMMKYFRVDAQQIEKTFSINFLGICFSSLMLGPISDSFGRKPPLIGSLGVLLVGSLITCFAKNYSPFLLGRFFQGLGAGGIFALGSAIIADLFPGMHSLHARNLINLFIPVLTASAPLLGLIITEHWTFKGNFIAISLVVFFAFVMNGIFFRETLQRPLRRPLSIRQIIRNYKQVGCNRDFWQLTSIICLLASGYMTFNSQIALLFMLDFGMKPRELSIYQGMILGTFLVGTLIGSCFSERLGLLRTKRLGFCFLVIGTILLAVTSTTQFQNIPLLLVISFLPFVVGFVWIQMVYFFELLQLFPSKNGTVSSLRTSTRLLIAAAFVEIAGQSYNSSVLPLVTLEVVNVSCVMVLIYFYEKRKA